MRNLMCLAALISAIGLHAQTSIQRSFHANGRLQEVRVTEDAWTTFVSYHESGRVFERGGFRGNERHGVWKRYDAHGKLVARVRFRNGLRHGRCIYAALVDGSRYVVEYSGGRLVHGQQYDPEGNTLAERDLR